MDMTGLITAMGGGLWALVFFVLALSVIVAVHEFGHYIVGRWSGIDADVFSVGFGPVLLKKTDSRGTQWQLAALPFGGYVKFRGDSNAASVGGEKGARNTMLGAPLWARTATVAAGPIFNFILSILLFAVLSLSRGEVVSPLQVAALEPVPMETGLQVGDTLLGVYVDGSDDLVPLEDIAGAVTPAPRIAAQIERDGTGMEVSIAWPYPPIIAGLQPRSAAMDVNLAMGDVVTAAGGVPIFAFSELQQAVADAKGHPLTLDVWRAGETLTFVVAPKRVDLPIEDGFETRWLLGITGGTYFTPATEATSVWGAFVGGVERTWYIITSSLSGLWAMITGTISTCNMSGPVGIAQASGQMATMGAVSFVSFIAVLSTAVGMMNLFPVPALDGGHLVFYAWEAVTGRPPSDGVLRVLMAFGLAVIITLMVFALGSDLFCP